MSDKISFDSIFFYFLSSQVYLLFLFVKSAMFFCSVCDVTMCFFRFNVLCNKGILSVNHF